MKDLNSKLEDIEATINNKGTSKVQEHLDSSVSTHELSIRKPSFRFLKNRKKCPIFNTWSNGSKKKRKR